MATISRRQYAQLYGPTKGDAVRLGDTALLAEIEHDYAVPGDECLHGGGKTLRDGLGLTPGYDSAQGALDMLISNAVIIDPVLGVVKADIGIKDGRIVKHPQIADCAVAGVKNAARGGGTITAFVVVKAGETLTADEVKEFCKGALAPYKVPREVRFREELPKTLVGKALRRELVAEELNKNEVTA